jgi:hypothetical protein
VPAEEMLNTFRELRDEIEQKILDWLEHPEEELVKLKEEREQERRERLETARREIESRNACAANCAGKAYWEHHLIASECSRTALI